MWALLLYCLVAIIGQVEAAKQDQSTYVILHGVIGSFSLDAVICKQDFGGGVFLLPIADYPEKNVQR